ncbi:hypothetical protein DL762_009565 [Monosporascus cannonballus]|uniref:2EXR domain-containing protein n=1 Tax=Monosporascus cannonballus TaxID=155416 RepID=A0ABY0GTP2_9PEZI|nr:hypothetical protein DL762_009565 [Monosporascus cannonballus]
MSQLPSRIGVASRAAQISTSSTTTAQTQVDDGSKPKSLGDLPLELREMIWTYALPSPRIFEALVYESAGLKMQLLERRHLKMPLAHVCFESRRIVKEAGYILTFQDENRPGDPGVWFHPQKDVIERTIWGPGDIRHQDIE